MLDKERALSKIHNTPFHPFFLTINSHNLHDQFIPNGVEDFLPERERSTHGIDDISAMGPSLVCVDCHFDTALEFDEYCPFSQSAYTS